MHLSNACTVFTHVHDVFSAGLRGERTSDIGVIDFLCLHAEVFCFTYIMLMHATVYWQGFT